MNIFHQTPEENFNLEEFSFQLQKETEKIPPLSEELLFSAEQEIFIAGELASPGWYEEVEGNRRVRNRSARFSKRKNF